MDAAWRRPDLTDITRRIGAAGLPARYLDGYLEMLTEVLATGNELAPRALQSRREIGSRAAEEGTSLRMVIDMYLKATRLVWRELPTGRQGDEPSAMWTLAEVGFQAANDAIVALVDGYEQAQVHAIRQAEAGRREFIDGLLYGRMDLGQLAERAQRIGLRLAGAYSVAVARTGEPFAEAAPMMRRIEGAMAESFGVRDVLITAKEGLLVCVAPTTLTDMPDVLARQAQNAAGTKGGWRVGVGRSHQGPGGVVHSYEEARGALDLAEHLDLDTPVTKAADLLVFQVLLRDRAAISDLVLTVLSPLREARGGAGPLLDTLAAYFSTGTIAGVARELNLSVRAVSYRLDRITKLTGYSTSNPYQRFTLEAAVLGARILDWPRQPLHEST